MGAANAALADIVRDDGKRIARDIRIDIEGASHVIIALFRGLDAIPVHVHIADRHLRAVADVIEGQDVGVSIRAERQRVGKLGGMEIQIRRHRRRRRGLGHGSMITADRLGLRRSDLNGRIAQEDILHGIGDGLRLCGILEDDLVTGIVKCA